MAPIRTARIDSNAADGTLAVAGDWTLANAHLLGDQVLKHARRPATTIDASQVGALDSAGASLLLELAQGGAIHGLDDDRRTLLDTIAKAQEQFAPVANPPPPGLLALLARIGESTHAVWRDVVLLAGFFGLVLTRAAQTLFRPRRWRVTSFVFHIEQTGLDAVPIITLLNFLVGAVIAFLGATVLRDFGASVFAVDLVGYSFLREFGVLLTAILVAGRSGSAFTAQIGSMKAREEVDAIRTLGLDPIQVLVIPRTLALLVSLPLLTFLAMVAGVVGGAAVCALTLDISPTMFITRFQDLNASRHFWVGMSKAPLFAFLIATIGCLEGFKVGGSAESVGTHTTSSVVQGIFMVILVDALLAIFFMEMNI